jgi:hypothetical protein
MRWIFKTPSNKRCCPCCVALNNGVDRHATTDLARAQGRTPGRNEEVAAVGSTLRARTRARIMMIKKLASALGATVVLFSGMTTVEAQRIDRGNGVVCDSPQLVERFIALDIDTKDAIARINAESTSGGTCEFIEAEYIVGGVVGDASNAKGGWEIRKVLIVGLIVGRVRKPVLAYEKYTAFIISKAAPL